MIKIPFRLPEKSRSNPKIANLFLPNSRELANTARSSHRDRSHISERSTLNTYNSNQTNKENVSTNRGSVREGFSTERNNNCNQKHDMIKNITNEKKVAHNCENCNRLWNLIDTLKDQLKKIEIRDTELRKDIIKLKKENFTLNQTNLELQEKLESFRPRDLVQYNQIQVIDLHNPKEVNHQSKSISINDLRPNLSKIQITREDFHSKPKPLLRDQNLDEDSLKNSFTKTSHSNSKNQTDIQMISYKANNETFDTLVSLSRSRTLILDQEVERDISSLYVVSKTEDDSIIRIVEGEDPNDYNKYNHILEENQEDEHQKITKLNNVNPSVLEIINLYVNPKQKSALDPCTNKESSEFKLGSKRSLQNLF